MQVTKYSGTNANGESYTISKIVGGQATVLITGTVVAAQQVASNEHCLDTSDNGVYKLTLVQGYLLVNRSYDIGIINLGLLTPISL